jgi:hypothetical protein
MILDLKTAAATRLSSIASWVGCRGGYPGITGELHVDVDGEVELPDRAGAAELSEYMDRSGNSLDLGLDRGSYVPGYDSMCSRIKWYADEVEAVVSVDTFREWVDEAGCVVGDVDSMMRQWRTTTQGYSVDEVVI